MRLHYGRSLHTYPHQYHPDPKDQMTTQLPTPVHSSTAKSVKRGGLVAGIGAGALVLACAAACAIPLVAAAGVAVGGGAILAGAWPVAFGILLLTAAVTFGLLWYRKQRRARAAASTDGSGASCACGGDCGC